jgi:flagellar motor protein MotB
MKRFLTLVALLAFFVVPVSAFTITAPEKVTAFSSWSLGIEFDLLDSFQSAVISLDGKKLATLYSNNQEVLDPFNGFRVIKATALDKKFFVSLSGMEPGTHSLLVETQNESGVVLASKTNTITAIDPLSAGYKEEAQVQLDTIKNQNDSLLQELEQLKQTNSALEQKIAQQQQAIEAQQKELDSLNDLSNWLQENQNSVTGFNASSAKQLQEMQNRLSELEQQLKNAGNGSVTGFALQTGTFSWSISTVLGILVLLAIVGYAVLQHVQEKKLY